MVNFKKREKALRKACRLLNIAGTLIYNSASGTEPFEISKLFNIMGKELFQQHMILVILLGDYPIEKFNPELAMHSSNILQAHKELFEKKMVKK